MAVASNYVKQCRSWDFEDSLDQSDVERLFKPESEKVTKPVRCMKYWSLYASICIFFGLFLLGLLVGFYVRADQNVPAECRPRKDGFDKETLEAVHNNIVYSMSAYKLAEYVRELSPFSKEQIDLWNEDERTARIVEREFRKFGLDHVAVEEYDVVVASPDPANPNRLEIVYPDGSMTHNISYGGSRGDNHVSESKKLAPFIGLSAAGKTEGPLVFGDYGTEADFLSLEGSTGPSLRGSLALLKIGQTPISHKVRIARSFGVAGLLLYCDEENGNHGNSCHDNQDVAWEDFKEQGTTIHDLPVQTVSLELASELLSNLSQNGTSLGKDKTAASTVQGNGIKAEYLSVCLHINNKLETRKVYNVVGTITGSDEPDRIVLVGAGRPSVISPGQAPLPSSAIQLELGRSLADIRATEGWEPRRTIRLASWGGQGWSQVGMLNYLMDHSVTLDSEAVAYIDLDLEPGSSPNLQYEASLSLEKLVQMAASMIPDPANPDLSLIDSWPQQKLRHYGAGYHGNTNMLPIMHQLGIPSVAIRKVQSDDQGAQKFFIQRDSTHHFKYHLATARVASLMLVQLSDFALLPLDVEFFTAFVQQLVSASLESVKQLLPANRIASLLSDLEALTEVGRGFPTHTSDCALSLKTRELNDMLMWVEQSFIQTVPSNRSQNSRDLLRQNVETGSLFVLSEAVKTFKMTGSVKPVEDYVDILAKTVKELTEELSVFHS